MSKEDYGPISQYNSLIDPNLQGFYSKSIIRHHLRQNGLINRRGEIIPEDVWRKKILTKERMEQASRLIANRIVQQAIEIKNLERSEIRRKLEEVSKKELVRRVRGKSSHSHQLPLLWSNSENSEHRDRHSRNRSRSSSPRLEDYDVQLIDEHDDYDKHRTFMKKQQLKRNKYKRHKRHLRTYNKCQRGYSAAPRPEPILLTMIYYGKGIKIPYDTQVFDSKDEITIYQQHCGGENLLVYSGLHDEGEKFSWYSKRHKEYPFSCTIYLNGTYDCRISTCCEYRHSLNCRIGGKTGRFGFSSIIGDHPCVKCMWEKASQKKNEEKEPEKDNYDSDFDDANDNEGSSDTYWVIKTYTSRQEELMEQKQGTDANVNVILFDSNNIETESCQLNKNSHYEYLKSVKNNEMENDNLFKEGQTDAFLVKTTINIGKLRSIKIQHDNNGKNPDWHLEKVEVINKQTGDKYVFKCQQWLSKTKGDRNISRILTLDTEPETRLKIPIQHAPEKSPSPETSRKSSRLPSPSPSPSLSPSPSPAPKKEKKSRRLTKDDIIDAIDKDDHLSSARSVDSISSRNKSIKSVHSVQSTQSIHSTRSGVSNKSGSRVVASRFSSDDSTDKSDISSDSDSTDSDASVEAKKVKVKKSSPSKQSRYSVLDRTQSVQSKKDSVPPSRQSMKSFKNNDTDSLREENEDDWTISVQTRADNETLDQLSLHIQLIETKNNEDIRTEQIFLNEENAVSKSQFRQFLSKPGSTCKFNIKPNKNLESLHKVVIGYDPEHTKFDSGIRLYSVQAKKVETDEVFNFVCDDILDESLKKTYLYEQKEIPDIPRSRAQSGIVATLKEALTPSRLSRASNRADSRQSKTSFKENNDRSMSRQSNGSVGKLASDSSSSDSEDSSSKDKIQRSASKLSKGSKASKVSKASSKKNSVERVDRSRSPSLSSSSTVDNDVTLRHVSDTESVHSKESMGSKKSLNEITGKVSAHSMLENLARSFSKKSCDSDRPESKQSKKSIQSKTSNKLVVEDDQLRSESKISKKSIQSKASNKLAVEEDQLRSESKISKKSIQSKASNKLVVEEDQLRSESKQSKKSVNQDRSPSKVSKKSIVSKNSRSASRQSEKLIVEESSEEDEYNFNQNKSSIGDLSLNSISRASLSSVNQELTNRSSTRQSNAENVSIHSKKSTKSKASAVNNALDKSFGSISRQSSRDGETKEDVKSSGKASKKTSARQSENSSRQSGTYIIENDNHERAPSKTSKKSLTVKSNSLDSNDVRNDSRASKELAVKELLDQSTASLASGNVNYGEIEVERPLSKQSKKSLGEQSVKSSKTSVRPKTSKANSRVSLKSGDHKESSADEEDLMDLKSGSVVKSKASLRSEKGNELEDVKTSAKSLRSKSASKASMRSQKSIKNGSSDETNEQVTANDKSHSPSLKSTTSLKTNKEDADSDELDTNTRTSTQSVRPKTSKPNSRATVRNDNEREEVKSVKNSKISLRSEKANELNNHEAASDKSVKNSKISLRSEKANELNNHEAASDKSVKNSKISLRSEKANENTEMSNSVKASQKSVRSKSSVKNSKTSLRDETSEEDGHYDASGNWVSGGLKKPSLGSTKGSKVSLRNDELDNLKTNSVKGSKTSVRSNWTDNGNN